MSAVCILVIGLDLFDDVFDACRVVVCVWVCWYVCVWFDLNWCFVQSVLVRAFGGASEAWTFYASSSDM